MSRQADISNSADIIDSRDIIARIDELTSQRADALETAGVEDTWTDGTHTYDASQWTEDDAEELRVLLALQDEADGSADWRHGEALIHDSYFETYARDLADDIGAVKSDASWPNSFIDWEAASEALKQDYTSVDYDGVTYWIRS